MIGDAARLHLPAEILGREVDIVAIDERYLPAIAGQAFARAGGARAVLA